MEADMPSADISLDRRFDSVHEKIAAIDANVVDVVVAAADVGGGGTAGLFSVQLKDQYGFDLDKVGAVAILAANLQYAGGYDANANVTLDTVTAGSILYGAAASGIWIVKTDATGLFACNANNAVDEQVWFSAGSVPGGGIDDLAAGVAVRGCIPDSATWSA
jgi:hypothetical protein